MRIVFAGTPEFAARSLGALLDAAPESGWTVPLVLTQPDRPAGRGMRLTPSPVKQLAQAHGLRVATPASLRKGADAEAAQQTLIAAAPDVLVVAAYGLILPQSVLDVPRGLRHDVRPPLAAINVHASLLPRWRGAAPIARAIEAADAVTGITIMQMDAGLDTGAMLLKQSLDIDAADTTATLTVRLAELGARLLVQALQSVEALVVQPQPADGATYARKIDKAEAWLDWTEPAAMLACKVRAFDPFPVAQTRIGEDTVRIWRAVSVDASIRDCSGHTAAAAPGTIMAVGAGGIDVACGAGQLRLTELQRAGGRRLGAAEFLTGHPLAPMQRFTSGPPHV